MAMVISGSDGVTFPDSTNQYSGAYFSFKNRIINGDMRIDQRNAGAAVTTSGAYPVDRFYITNTTNGAFSAQRDTVAPSGFTNSLKFTTTTADASVTTTQQCWSAQNIEGFNAADLMWGTANAKTITLSFWVRSSLTGTFGGAISNSAQTRSYPYTYSISSANTWEYKTITISGDTSGTWLTDNGVGIRVFFGLGVGPDRSGTAGAWNSNVNTSATGATSVIGTLNATWYITGVQLEVGSVATPFERRPYGTELALCLRYYAKLSTLSGANNTFASGVCDSTTNGFVNIKYPQRMRSAPTATQSNTSVYDGSQQTVTSAAASYAGDETAAVNLTVASGLTVGRGCVWLGNNSSAFVTLSSEL